MYDYGKMFGQLQGLAGQRPSMNSNLMGGQHGANGFGLAPNMQTAMQAAPGQATMAQGPGAVLGGAIGQAMPWAQNGNSFVPPGLQDKLQASKLGTLFPNGIPFLNGGAPGQGQGQDGMGGWLGGLFNRAPGTNIFGQPKTPNEAKLAAKQANMAAKGTPGL